jgi:hypothetical protein
LIILDEEEYAKKLLKKVLPKPYISVQDLTILAKYYKFMGKENHEVRALLEKFCRESNKEYNLVSSGWKIDRALNKTKSYRIRTNLFVTVTKSEVEKIKEFNNYNYQKLLFVLLVIGKFSKYAKTRIVPSNKTYGINQFYVNDDLSNTVKIARVPFRKDQQNKFLYAAYEKGFLDGTIYKTLLLKYIDESSEPEIVVTDINDPVLFWQRYMGEKIAACSVCGKLFAKRSNRHSMCRSCFEEQRKDKRKEYNKKYYENKNI